MSPQMLYAAIAVVVIVIVVLVYMMMGSSNSSSSTGSVSGGSGTVTPTAGSGTVTPTAGSVSGGSGTVTPTAGNVIIGGSGTVTPSIPPPPPNVVPVPTPTPTPSTPALPPSAPIPAGVTNSVSSTTGGLMSLLISPAGKFIAGVFGSQVGVFGLPAGAHIASYDPLTYTVSTPMSIKISDTGIKPIQQNDGNFVIYSDSGAQYRSNGASKTSASAGPFSLVLDDTGTLTTMDSKGSVVWSSVSPLQKIGNK